MTWLLTQMWALMGAAALIALIFGWGLRGAMLRGRLRRTEVEAGLARTELEQARTEIEGLYAAQRKLGDGSPEMKADLEARDQHIAALNDQIMDMKSELQDLKDGAASNTGGLGTVAAGVAGAVAGAVAHDQLDGAVSDELDSARARIGELEGQVTGLQGELEAALNAPVVEQPLPGGGEPVAIPTAVDTVEVDKLRWQNDYLRTRLKVFEQNAGVQLSGEPPAGPEDLPPESEVAAVDAPDSAENRETPDEELARLRWRNRYLEGRLAYLEEERGQELDEPEFATAVSTDPTPDEVSVEAQQVGAELETAPVDVPVSAEQPLATEPEPAVTVEEEPTPPAPQVTASEPEMPVVEDALAAAPLVAEPVEEMPVTEPTSVVEPQRPISIDEPASYEDRDDLTQIEGIGPRIQDVLHSIGVYKFDQIAKWSPANEAWVDDYLSFSGRVGSENWVEQARNLSGVTTPSA